MKVEVVYINAQKEVFQYYCQLAENACVADALEASQIYQKYPETLSYDLGVFSKPVTPTTRLQSGDRVEVYRPLLGDPKEKRRQRAKK